MRASCAPLALVMLHSLLLISLQHTCKLAIAVSQLVSSKVPFVPSVPRCLCNVCASFSHRYDCKELLQNLALPRNLHLTMEHSNAHLVLLVHLQAQGKSKLAVLFYAHAGSSAFCVLYFCAVTQGVSALCTMNTDSGDGSQRTLTRAGNCRSAVQYSQLDEPASPYVGWLGMQPSHALIGCQAMQAMGLLLSTLSPVIFKTHGTARLNELHQQQR